MALTVTKPAYEPVSVDELRTHARIDATDEDAYLLPTCIKSATEIVQDYTHRRLITQTVEWRLDCWRPVLEFPYTPVQSFSSVKYVDGNGTEQALAASEYQTDIYSEPPRVMPAYGETWPDLREQTFNAITVTAVVGYGTPVDVPKTLRLGVLVAAATLYENREEWDENLALNKIKMMISPYRIRVFH